MVYIRSCGDLGKSNKGCAGFLRISERKRPLSAAKVNRSRGGTTQVIRPYGVCAASDAMGSRAQGVGVPKEALLMRRTLAQCKMRR